MKTATFQPSISPPDLYRLLREEPPVEILDVRTATEHRAAHIPGSTMVPLHELDPHQFLARRTQADSPLYVICQSGGRARKAIEKFHTAGFDQCVLVEGGLDGWSAAGLPVQRSARPGLPLLQQVHLIIGLSTALSALLALTLNPWFAVIPLITGCGLIINGVTGWCGLALILDRMPWNHPSPQPNASCCKV